MSASAYVLIFESESLAGLSARNGAVSGFGHAGSANLLILTTVRDTKAIQLVYNMVCKMSRRMDQIERPYQIYLSQIECISFSLRQDVSNVHKFFN